MLPGTLDARWTLAGLPMPMMVATVAKWWHRHCGFSILKLPRTTQHTWAIPDLAAELDRVGIGVRSVEIYCMEAARGGKDMYYRSVGSGSEAAATVPLEPCDHSQHARRGAKAVRRLQIATDWPAPTAPLSLAAVQALFPSLCDLTSRSCTVGPAAAAADDGAAPLPLRPFRVLQLLGYYNFADHAEFQAAIAASPDVQVLAAKEINLETEYVKSIPERCPALKLLKLEDCSRDGFVDNFGREKLAAYVARRLPDADSVSIQPEYF